MLQFSTLTAQDNHVIVDRVPFVDCKQQTINQFFQDTTGLMWLLGQGQWYTSNGEKVIKVPMPFKNDSIRFMNTTKVLDGWENLYFPGDSVRVYNPYSRKIIQSIGMDENSNANWKHVYFFNITPTTDGTIWATCAPIIGNGYRIGNDFAIMVSHNGAPFRHTKKEIFGSSLTKYLAVRGDQIFVTIRDTLLQYDIDGNLKKTYAFPKINKYPKIVNFLYNTDEPVELFHYIQNRESKKLTRAIYSLKPNSSKLEHIDLPGLPPEELGTERLDKTGEDFWLLGSKMSVYHFVPGKEKAFNFSKYVLEQHPEVNYYHDDAYKVYQDNTGTLWFSTQNRGIFKFSSTKEPFKRYLGNKKAYSFCASNSCVIRGITEDDQGNIYFCYEFGVQKLDIQTGELSEVKLNLPENLKSVYSLTYFNDKLYLDELEIDLQTGNVVPIIPGLNNHHVTHLIDKKTGQMWIADAGEILVRRQPIQLYQYDLNTKDLKEFTRLEPKARNDLNQVSQIYLSPTTKTLFVATIATGVYELNLDGTIVQNITGNDPVRSITRSLSFYEDSNQQLWIGHEEGLSRLNLKTKEFTEVPYHSTDPLAKRAIYSIQTQNETYCWLGTSSGLYRLNVETGEMRNFKMFPRQSVMEFNRLSSHQDQQGNLYFGSMEGLYVFDPDQLTKDARFDETFPIQLLRVSHFDVKQDTILHTYPDSETSTTFEVYPRHRFIRFDVFAPDYRDTEKNQYSWWLENYDSRWSKLSTSNTIQYDNLPPGNYTLHVKGGISADYYQSSERQFQIVVHQVWYKTGWAYAVYLTLFLGLVYLIYQYQVRQQLEKAEAKRLKEMDSLKTRLYTNITHEFRTPLTVIMGMVDNIRGHQNEKKLISRNSENLLRLVNQLLDLSKLDSGTMKLDLIQADIINYLQYLTESFYSMAEEKKVRLMFYPEIKELQMDFDEVKIQHIVYNLLSNAIKFSNAGDKVVLHTTEADKNGQLYLKLKVTDTGIGISENDLENIFDRFYQADGSSTRKGEGTGIGLALTKELIGIMGGTISVQSQLGEGTEFMILLPIHRNADTPQMEMELAPSKKMEQELVLEHPVEKRENGFTFKDKPQLLIIEDNRDVTTYLTTLLNADYEILTASNGKAGVEKALETIPDIVISDVMMPEMDGYEVSQTLKNDERTSHIPIILLTAKAAVDDRIEGLGMGADAFLTKPFNKKELFVRLEQLIKLRQKLQEQYNSFKIQFSAKPSLDEAFIQKLVDAVEARLDDPDFGVVHLCRAANLSNMQVNRKLKALTGKTPSRFIRSIRLHKAKELLKTTDLNISEIAYEVGFSDPNYFSRSFSEEFGHSPNVIRK